MDLILKRRAVYTGLRPYLSNEELVTALNLWQVEFSDKPKFAFTAFLAVITNSEALRKKRTRILSSLLRAMELSEVDLLADPYDEKGKQYQFATEDLIAEDQATEVFITFFEKLQEKVGEKNALGMRAYIIQNVKKLNLNTRNSKQLTDWIDDKATILNGQYNLNNLRQVINLAYVAMCQLIGPVKADQLLAQTIRDVEAFAVEKQINLHDLL
jgi:Flp pilus assembly CpaF family ATPase